MAVSGSKSVQVTSWDTLKFSWEQTASSFNSASRVWTYSVYWQLELISTAYGAISSTAPKAWDVLIGDNYYSGTNTVGISNNSRKILASGTATLYHNILENPNVFTFNYSFNQTFDIDFDGWVGTKSGSGVGEIAVDVVKSTLTANNGTLGSAQTLTINRQISSLTHTITYACGTASGTIATQTSDATVSWTPPLTLASQNTVGTTVSVTFTITTYSGGADIGSNTKTITCSIPASVKPSCSVTVTDPTGYADVYGGYVQGQSKLAIKVTPQVAYGAEITAYAVTADGNSFTTSEVTTAVVQSTGTLTINASVTDTRSRTGSASKTVAVLPYARPVINTLKVHRCNEDGTENDRGLYAKVTYAYTIDTLGGKNGMSGYIQYKKTTETEYTTVALPTALIVTEGTFIFAADDGSTYDVQLLVADNFISVGHRTALSTAYTLIHYAPNGKGITFGGIRNDGGFNIVDMPFKINDIDVDYVVEQGEVDGWFYRKWNGGFAECWKIYYGTGIVSAKNNYSGFYYSETIMVPFPFTFTNLPTVTVDGGSVTYMNFVRTFGRYSDMASFTVVSLMDAGNVDITVDIKAIGRWK